MTTYLVLSNIEVIHVHQGDGVSVLIVIQEHADLVERELYVKARCLLVEFVVHDDLASLTSGFTFGLCCRCFTLPSPETGLRMN